LILPPTAPDLACGKIPVPRRIETSLCRVSPGFLFRTQATIESDRLHGLIDGLSLKMEAISQRSDDFARIIEVRSGE